KLPWKTAAYHLNFNELNRRFNKQAGLYDLKVANALWAEKTYPFKPAYFDSISKYYGSDSLHGADFRSNFSQERTTINRWVLQQTNDRIKDLIPDFPPEIARQI